MASTYSDIIDGKVAEWRKAFSTIEQQIENSSSDARDKMRVKLAEFRPKLDDAIARLHSLDKQESVENTVETKDNILKIFDEIDRSFPKYKELTPFML